VFKSTNSGGNWTPINAGLANLDIRALAVDPLSLNKIYAGTFGNGVFKSIDGGANWLAVNAGLTNRYITNLEVHPQSPNKVYAGTHYGGVFTISFNAFLINISKIGTGNGTVTSTPTGIDCGVNCAYEFDANSTITLAATPVVGSVFADWSGDCSGSNTVTTV